MTAYVLSSPCGVREWTHQKWFNSTSDRSNRVACFSIRMCNVIPENFKRDASYIYYAYHYVFSLLILSFSLCCSYSHFYSIIPTFVVADVILSISIISFVPIVLYICCVCAPDEKLKFKKNCSISLSVFEWKLQICVFGIQ